MNIDDKKNAIFLRVKELMKIKGIKYANLAEEMQMSESGVKKMFREKNPSIEKLLVMSKVLEVSLKQLIDHVDDPMIAKQVRLNKKSDHYLADHPRLFYLLRFIQTKKITKGGLLQIGFTEADLYDLRKFLHEFNLLNENESIFSMYKTCLQMPGYNDSKLRKLILQKYGKIIFEKELENIGKSSLHQPLVWSASLSLEDQKKLLREIKNLLIKYQDRSDIYKFGMSDDEEEMSLLIVPSLYTPGAEIEGNLDSF